MANRTYFVKVSWRVDCQPLMRHHHNDTVLVDLTLPHYEVVSIVKRQVVSRWEDVQDFTIDFMIPTGED